MEDQAELIRQQMQEKRAELSEKLQTLGEMLPKPETVAETVESVSDSVTNTAETVQETVESVQDAFDLPKQVQEHPWLAVGGAVLVGYLAHGALTSRNGGPSLLSEPLRLLGQFATRNALELVGQMAQGQALGAYGPILSSILEQLSGDENKPATQSSSPSPPNGHNGHGATKQPARAAY
jgi:ElaB/YqjD/DUF883 family membrane-anchored ribosome-binding protein